LKGNLETQLSELPKLKTERLRSLWQEVFGKPPHPKLRRELLIPIIAYRLQERAFGGLKPATLRRLEAINSGKQVRKQRGLQPGTRMVRQWQGKMYEAVTVEQGYIYDGRKYRSLSEIARAITGTRWSGPAFFGLRQKSREAA